MQYGGLRWVSSNRSVVSSLIQMKKLLVFFLVTAITTAAAAEAGEKILKRQSKQESKRTEARGVADKPASIPTPASVFTMSMIAGDRLDPSYTGPAINQVISEVEKFTSLRKGEFESTEDYNARKADAIKREFLGGLHLNDTFAFVVPVAAKQSDPLPIKYSFNADIDELRIFITPERFLPSETSELIYKTSSYTGLNQLNLFFKIESEADYQASNAYGATTTVHKTIISTAGVLAEAGSFLELRNERQRGLPAAVAQIKLDASKVRGEILHLKSLLIVKPVEPFIIKNDLHNEPTWNYPSEVLITSKYLFARVLGVIVFSGTSGEVFARLPENFGK